MTREEAGKRAAIMQAYADGKTIQHQCGGWVDLCNPAFDCGVESYRVKPEPRRFWIVDGRHAARKSFTRKGAAELYAHEEGESEDKIIEVVEVLK